MVHILRFLKSDTSTIYHIVSRTALNGYPINDAGKNVLLGLIKKFSAFYVVDVLGFSLMGNHFHLVVRMYSPSEVSDEEVRRRLVDSNRKDTIIAPSVISNHKKIVTSLPRYIKFIKQAFTCYYNKTNHRRGCFWGDRFRSLIVEDGLTLINLLAYIDLNPVRAGLVKKPEEYNWNTLGYHMKTGNKDGLLSVDFGMQEWNEDDPAERVGKYREFVYETGAIETDKEKAMDADMAQTERMKQFRLARVELFKNRTRYFTDAGIIGSKAFVQKVFEQKKHLLGSKDTRKFKHVIGTQGVYSMKNLNK